jgi:hypothetical protein
MKLLMGDKIDHSPVSQSKESDIQTNKTTQQEKIPVIITDKIPEKIHTKQRRKQVESK